jgi:hypothetical protein
MMQLNLIYRVRIFPMKFIWIGNSFRRYSIWCWISINQMGLYRWYCWKTKWRFFINFNENCQKIWIKWINWTVRILLRVHPLSAFFSEILKRKSFFYLCAAKIDWMLTLWSALEWAQSYLPLIFTKRCFSKNCPNFSLMKKVKEYDHQIRHNRPVA